MGRHFEFLRACHYSKYILNGRIFSHPTRAKDPDSRTLAQEKFLVDDRGETPLYLHSVW